MKNVNKIVWLIFFSSLYFYGHLGTLYFRAKGLNLGEVGIIEGILVLSLFLFEVPTGIIADKIGYKKSIILALAFQAIGEILFLFADSFFMFGLIAVIGGIGFSFSSGTIEALLYESLEDKNEMDKYMGRVGSSYQKSFFLAALMGSFLVKEFSIDKFLMLVLLTVISVLIALGISFTLNDVKYKKEGSQSSLKLLKRGMKVFKGDKKLLKIASISILTNGFHGILVIFYPVYFNQNGINSREIGLSLAGASFLAIFTEKYGYKLKRYIGFKWSLLVTIFFPGILYIILGTLTSKVWIIVIFLLLYSTINIKGVYISKIQNKRIDSDIRAMMLSLINQFSGLYISIITIVVGYISNTHMRLGFIMLGGVIILSAIILRVDRVEDV